MHLTKKKTNIGTKVNILIGSIFVVHVYHFFKIKVFNHGIPISIFLNDCILAVIFLLMETFLVL